LVDSKNSKKLNLSFTWVSEAWIQTLPLSLIDLNLRNCEPLFKKGPSGKGSGKGFGKLEKLQKLTIRSTEVSDAWIKTLPISLIDLDLVYCWELFKEDPSGKGSDKGFGRLTKLQKLNIRSTKVSDAWIETLPLSLIDLSLDHCKKLFKIGAFGPGFGRLTNLQKLSLAFTEVRDPWIQTLPISLIDLNLRSCWGLFKEDPSGKGSDKGFGRLKKLQKLNIRSTKVSEAWIKTLPISLKRLQLPDGADYPNTIDQLKKRGVQIEVR